MTFPFFISKIQLDKCERIFKKTNYFARKLIMFMTQISEIFNQISKTVNKSISCLMFSLPISNWYVTNNQ